MSACSAASRIVLLSLLVLTPLGCVTLQTGKIDPAGTNAPSKACGWFGNRSAVVEGQRYCLPKPLIVYKLGDDGTMKATVEYVPDPQHHYAIGARSYSAKHTLNVETTGDGILKKVVFKPDSTAVATKAAEAGGSIVKTLADQVAANKKADDEAAAKATAARQAALAELGSAVAKAKVDWQTAEATALSAEAARDATTDAAEKAKATATAASARAAADYKKKIYEDLKAQADREKAPTKFATSSNQNNPDETPSRRDQVYSPVVYVVDDSAASVKLTPITITDVINGNTTSSSTGQEAYDTMNLHIADEEKKGEISVSPAPADGNPIEVKQGEAFKITKITGKYSSYTVTILQGGTPLRTQSYAQLKEGSEDTYTVPTDLAVGTYTVIIEVDQPSRQNVDANTFKLKVVKP